MCMCVCVCVCVCCLIVNTHFVWFIYYNKLKTSYLIISDNTPPSTEFLDRTNVVYMFKYPLRDCVSKENSEYVGHTTTNLFRRPSMQHNDSSSLVLHLKIQSIPKSEFRKILVENTIKIAHEINKIRLQILEALHKKKKIR